MKTIGVKRAANKPDAVAYQDGKRVRIEFEYRSRNFMVHRHKASGCDCSSAGLVTLAVLVSCAFASPSLGIVRFSCRVTK
jgi:hypothetical protein